MAVGAHPGFDLVGFGRRTMERSRPTRCAPTRSYQRSALLAGSPPRTASGSGTLAPHGRLGTLVATRRDYAPRPSSLPSGRWTTTQIVLAQDGELLTPPGVWGCGRDRRDRRPRVYRDEMAPSSRDRARAVLHDEDVIAARTVRMVREGLVTSVVAGDLPVRCDTVLLHGATPRLGPLARRIRSEIEADVECALCSSRPRRAQDTVPR
ncbi:LamB/YcsF family protein [Pseudonocardia sp. MCCB 268]|nr:LamB/YcsF family protein [Pseudonocardia cytotoxica]